MELSKDWESHFELGYRDDLEFVKSMIAEGETSPFRILHHLAHRMRLMERDSHLEFKPGTEQEVDLSQSKMEWWPKEFEGRFGLLPTGVDACFESSVLGYVVPVPFYNEIKSAPGYFLSDLINDQFDCVVDLGCGFGSTLFDLYRFGCDLSIKYLGGEYSEAAVELVNLLSGLQDDFDLTAHHFDFNEPDVSFVKDAKSVLYVTNRAVQVINPISRGFFIKLLDSAEQVQCVHFEPIGFQRDDGGSAVSEAQREDFMKHNWNTNLLSMLEKLQAEGKIKLDYYGKDILFGGDPTIPNSVAMWSKL